MRSKFLWLLAVGFPVIVFGAAPASDTSRRMFDFTPVSADNPVVARIGETIAIPASEYRAYQKTEKIHAITDPSSLAQKRAVLEDLISEYLYVDEAYRHGVAESAGFTKRMDYTRSLLLADFLTAQTVNPAAATPEANNASLDALTNRLFDAATIEVSNEAYAALKTVTKAIDTASAASQRGPIIDPPSVATAKLRQIVETAPEGVLARYLQKSISIKQLLAIYAGLSAPRPRLDTQEALVDMLKPIIVPELMAVEAAKRGIDATPAFQNKVIENRNALLRFKAQGLIESRANETLKAPDVSQRLQAWYAAHADQYAMADEGGVKKVPALADVRQRVEGDFSLDLRDQLRAAKAEELRRAQPVSIDEAVLRGL